MLVIAVADQAVIEKLRAVVTVDAEQGDGEALVGTLEAPKDVFLGLVENADRLGPTGEDIGHGEGAQEARECRSTVVPHQIDFDESRHDIIPVGKGADGDLTLEKATRMGERAALEEPVDRSGTHGKQLVPR